MIYSYVWVITEIIKYRLADTQLCSTLSPPTPLHKSKKEKNSTNIHEATEAGKHVKFSSGNSQRIKSMTQAEVSWGALPYLRF